MKRIVVLLLICCGSVNAQEIIPRGKVEISYFPNYVERMYSDHWEDYNYPTGVFQTDIMIGGSYGPLFIEGEIITRSDSSNFMDRYTFSPFQDEYYIRVGLDIKSIVIGAEHLCMHPVFSNKTEENPLKQGGYDRIYFKWEF